MKKTEKIPLTSEKELGHDILWESFRSGNQEAFEHIFRRYYPVLFRYGLKFTGREEEIKDFIQSLFMQIWERRQFLGPTTSVRNYLLASLRRLLHKNSDLNVGSLFDQNLDFHVELSFESKLIASQTEARNARLVKSAFDKLPVRQKEAIYLRFYDDQSFSEIANIMGISVRATYKLIYKGLDSLQEQLEGKDIDIGYHLSLLFILANQQAPALSDSLLNGSLNTGCYC